MISLKPKTKRILWISIGIAALLYAAVYALGKYYLTPANLKNVLLPRIEAKLNKKISFNEDIYFSITWQMQPHIIVHNLVVENTLTADKLDICFDLLKLIFSELEIAELNLENALLYGLHIEKLVLNDLYLDKHKFKIDLDKLKAGSSDLQGELSAKIDPIDIEGEFKSSRLSFGDFQSTNDPDGYSIPDIELPIDQLKSADLDIDFKVKKLLIGKLALDNVKLNIFNKNKTLNLELKPAAGLANGSLNLSASFDLKPAIPTFKLNVSSRNLDLEPVLKMLLDKSPITGSKLEFNAQLQSSGKNLRSLVNNLRGQILTTAGPGQYLNASSSIGSIFTNILSAMITFDKRQSTTQFGCAVVNLQVNNGVASAKNGIGLEASSVNVLGSGTADLRNGQINFRINPQNLSQNPIDIAQFSIAQSITVTGTINNPQVKLDPLAAISSGPLSTTIISSLAAGIPGGIAAVTGSMLNPNKSATSSKPCQTALGK